MLLQSPIHVRLCGGGYEFADFDPTNQLLCNQEIEKYYRSGTDGDFHKFKKLQNKVVMEPRFAVHVSWMYSPMHKSNMFRRVR